MSLSCWDCSKPSVPLAAELHHARARGQSLETLCTEGIAHKITQRVMSLAAWQSSQHSTVFWGLLVMWLAKVNRGYLCAILSRYAFMLSMDCQRQA